MIIADGKHGLIRFERDMPRSKLLIDEADELRPYLARFEEIWTEGGVRITHSVTGLRYSHCHFALQQMGTRRAQFSCYNLVLIR